MELQRRAPDLPRVRDGRVQQRRRRLHPVTRRSEAARQRIVDHDGHRPRHRRCAETRVDIPFTLHVPPTASPGDHTAGIVASLPTPTSDADNHRVILDRRTGSRVYVRVNGPVNPSLVVENLSSDYHGSFNPLDGTLDVTYTLRNPGNVRLGARELVAVHDLFGRTVAERKPRSIPELLPGNAITVREKFNGVPATFRLGADVTITPLVPAGVELGAARQGDGRNAFVGDPVDVVARRRASEILLWRLYRRYRSSQSTAPPLGPGTPAAGRDSPPALRPAAGSCGSPSRSVGSVGVSRAVPPRRDRGQGTAATGRCNRVRGRLVGVAPGVRSAPGAGAARGAGDRGGLVFRVSRVRPCSWRSTAGRKAR